MNAGAVRVYWGWQVPWIKLTSATLTPLSAAATDCTPARVALVSPSE